MPSVRCKIRTKKDVVWLVLFVLKSFKQFIQLPRSSHGCYLTCSSECQWWIIGHDELGKYKYVLKNARIIQQGKVIWHQVMMAILHPLFITCFYFRMSQMLTFPKLFLQFSSRPEGTDSAISYLLFLLMFSLRLWNRSMASVICSLSPPFLRVIFRFATKYLI